MSQATQLQQVCTFYLGELCFGIDVLKVQEVLKAPALNRVPLARRTICGLLNLRGQIVTVVDLRHCLTIGDVDRPAKQMCVIVYGQDSNASLLVDRMGDVLELEAGQIEEPPHTLPANIRSLVSGVCQLDKGLLLMLDLAKTLDLDFVKGA